MARTATQSRHLPDEYRKWNSVFPRYRRWVVTGVFGAILETIAAFVERDASMDLIDRTVVPGVSLRRRTNKGIRNSRGSFAGRRLYTQAHARCDS
ncbi:hypothetical protein [Sphingomonas sp. HMP9]|uniref:hypothetical protein n=1 Tax=Sphingomonas sp. HMP9 TaxID=1517554 RepID=UPI003FA6BD74